MDNLTHGLAGALLAQTGFRQRYGSAATVALIVGAELPDLDFLFDLAGAVNGFQHHRGITHAFTGGFGLALIAAAVLYAILRYRAYWRLVGLLYLGVLLHIWMDYLTSYGTQFFLPFDAGRYTADAVFIIDFFYTGLIATALLLLGMVRQQRHTRYRHLSLLVLGLGFILWTGAHLATQQPLTRLAVSEFGKHLVVFALVIVGFSHLSRSWRAHHDVLLARGGVFALAAYMAVCLVNQQVAKQRFAAALGDRMATVQRVSALPLPGGALYWRGIAETSSTYLVGHLSLLPSVASEVQAIPKGLDHSVVQSTSDYRLVRIFQEFARFPVVQYQENGSGRLVRYSDLRFTGYYGRETSWFDLEVHLDSEGQVRVIEFLNRLFPPHHPEF